MSETKKIAAREIIRLERIVASPLGYETKSLSSGSTRSLGRRCGSLSRTTPTTRTSANCRRCASASASSPPTPRAWTRTGRLRAPIPRHTAPRRRTRETRPGPSRARSSQPLASVFRIVREQWMYPRTTCRDERSGKGCDLTAKRSSACGHGLRHRLVRGTILAETREVLPIRAATRATRAATPGCPSTRAAILVANPAAIRAATHEVHAATSAGITCAAIPAVSSRTRAATPAATPAATQGFGANRATTRGCLRTRAATRATTHGLRRRVPGARRAPGSARAWTAGRAPSRPCRSHQKGRGSHLRFLPTWPSWISQEVRRPCGQSLQPPLLGRGRVGCIC